jgi:quercetin dioxygenase-like cupin family protein
VDAHQFWRRLHSHKLGDDCATLRHELLVSEALHQHGPGTGNVGGVPPGRDRPPGKAVTWHGWNHDIEGVGCISAVCGGIGQRIDDFHLFGDRARPSVRDDQRQRIFVFRAEDGPMPGYVTLNMEVEIEAGTVVPRHTHPGIEPSYVLEGGFELPIQGQPTRTLKAGDGFQIPPEMRHAGGKPGDKKTRIAITYVVEKGKPARVSSLKHVSPKGSRRRLWLPGNRADGYRPAIGGTIERGI